MAVIEIMSGPLQGTKVEIDRDELTLGRSEGNTLVLDDPSISGRHCVIRREGGKLTLRDLDSTNGTRLNGKNVHEARLKPLDVILVGEIEIRVDGDDIEVEPVEPPPAEEIKDVVPTVVTRPPSVSAPAPGFQERRDNRGLWVVAVAVALLLVVAAVVMFLMTVFK